MVCNLQKYVITDMFTDLFLIELYEFIIISYK